MEQNVFVEIQLLENFDQSFPLPSYETLGSAGMDIKASLGDPQEKIVIPNRGRALIPTGFKVAIPKGYEIQVRPRSGLSFKTGLMVVNSPGTIDSDYRGEVKIILGNLGDKDEIIKHGDRIAQIVLAKVPQIEWKKVTGLDATQRGEGGFGSTGQN